MTYRGIAAPTGIDLFAQTNGMLYVRQPTPGENTPWRSHPLGTSNVERARTALLRWLAKNKINGIDALTVPIYSTVGQLDANGGSLSRQIKDRRGGGRRKKKGRALVPYDPAVARNVEKARAALAEKRAVQQDAVKTLRKVKPILAALAASMEAAAINLRQVTDMIEEADHADA
jgi:hypothetical protein